jgi:hypothetical protein
MKNIEFANSFGHLPMHASALPPLLATASAIFFSFSSLVPLLLALENLLARAHRIEVKKNWLPLLSNSRVEFSFGI